ncbi:MAG: hypothetical protein OXU66_00020 [Gammaproteobacteria bacterium]|nr:hypothetical protein [Gammaproteobacteria bacterium]MDD9957299.1 hypothetical protein [Gammaproteobacteria bacterium]
MPTKQTPDDADLSRLLSQAEPPESPEHLDETILQYAKTNAPKKEKETIWFPRSWTTAVATLSVAAIAISVTITSFNSGDLERSVSDTVPLQVATSDALLDEAIEADSIALVREQQLEVVEDLNVQRQVAQNIETLANIAADEPEIASARATAFAAAAVEQVEITAADADSLNEPEVQADLAATAPQLARATGPTVSARAISTAASEVPVAIADLPALLSLVENLLADTIQGEREESSQVLNESERAVQLQIIYAAANGDTLEAFNLAYSELQTSVTDFTLPSTLARAIEQLQQLAN